MSIEDRLRDVALKVRRGIEGPQRVFQSFPKGCCQGASLLLARYVIEAEGLAPVTGVANGTRCLRDGEGEPVEQSHFWLECRGYIVDITADQFDDGPAAVIVTADRSWHDQFKGQARLDRSELLPLNHFLDGRYDVLLRQVAQRRSS